MSQGGGDTFKNQWYGFAVLSAHCSAFFIEIETNLHYNFFNRKNFVIFWHNFFSKLESSQIRKREV